MTTDLTLIALADAIRERRTTAVAATRACLDRIERLDGGLCAFIAVEPDAALATAALRDAELQAGRSRGPLHGVPLAIKDIFGRAGKPTTVGSRVYADRIASRTAAVIMQLEAAGAVLLGTLNLDEFAAGGTGVNVHYGRCRNPWDVRRISGGSSSGTAAAVAARLVPAALGSDTGGSIRLPAAFCGITALKPTYGRVCLDGVFPRARPFDCVGPAARNVDDCRLLYSVLAGTDGSAMPATDPAAPLAYAKRGAAALRLGIATAPFAASAQSGVLACLDAAAAVFDRLGVHRSDVDLPDLDLITRLHQVVVKTEGALLHRDVLRRDAERISLPARSAIEAGLFLHPSRQREALAVRSALLERFVARAFAEADAVLLPVVGMIAPQYDDSAHATPADIVAFFGEGARACRFVNYLGLPALALPCGFVDGMPVGLQLIARPFREDVLFALGAAFQNVTDFHSAAPPAAAGSPAVDTRIASMTPRTSSSPTARGL